MAKAAKPSAKAGAKAAPKSPGRRAKAVPGAEGNQESATAPEATAVVAVVNPTVLKLKDLLDRVAARSGARKPAVRPVLDAVLAELGEALEQGQAFSLAPLGRGRVSRSKAGGKGTTLVIKLKRTGGEKDAAPPLAPGEE